MKRVGEAAEKAARHRKFHWCRRPNGFSDMPVWRVVAAMSGAPLCQVLAFVNRLEEIANAAEQRGSVEDYKAQEFAAALDIPLDIAARIFATLQHPDIGWVAYEHVVTFHPRNPDKEDETAAERKRRQRARDRGMKDLAALAAEGRITPDQRAVAEAQLLMDHRLSNGHACHIVTPRDHRDVTPEQSIGLERPAEKTPAGAPGETDGFQGEAADPLVAQIDACKWLMENGKRLLVSQMQVSDKQAAAYIDRWRESVRDDVILKKFISEADKTLYAGARFHNIISDQIRRHVAVPRLPLPPVIAAKKEAAG